MVAYIHNLSVCIWVHSQESTTAVQIILPIQYTNMLPARKVGVIVLPTNQLVNQYMPTGLSCSITNAIPTSWKVAQVYPNYKYLQCPSVVHRVRLPIAIS